jgi:electron transport complex protein RnfE
MMLGALREIAGSGTLLAGSEMLGGDGSLGIRIDLPFDGMLVAILPPGAFYGMTVLLAVRNRLATATAATNETPAPALAEAPR